MQRFEYRVELIEKGSVVNSAAYVNKLNEFGQGGWEIISTEYAERKSKPMVSVLMKRSFESVVIGPLVLNEVKIT